MSPDPRAAKAGEAGTHRARRAGIAAIAVLVLLAAASWWIWGTLLAGDTIATSNAYVKGNIVVVTPQVAGTVLAIHADETGRVEAGQILVTLDATDARNTLSHEAVRLARAVRETRALYLTADTLRSSVAIRQSGVERARAEFARAAEGFKRREALQSSGAVSREELQNARASYDAARSELAAAESGVVAAREELLAHLALTEGLPLEKHPAIEEAALAMREAWLAVKRAEIRAPLSGQVAQRQVQLGQRVPAGANLMSIVALDRVWVEANFKEGQLRDIRIGQPVSLTSDLYGTAVRFTGRVAGLGAGTGSAFALLPAQNASGNWIKIVQRIPVRVALDTEPLSRYPLRVGLSMNAVVDTQNRDGPMLSDASQESASISTDVFQSLDRGADEAVQRVIGAHLKSDVSRRAENLVAGRSPIPR